MATNGSRVLLGDAMRTPCKLAGRFVQSNTPCAGGLVDTSNLHIAMVASMFLSHSAKCMYVSKAA